MLETRYNHYIESTTHKGNEMEREYWEKLGELDGQTIYPESVLYYKDDGKQVWDVIGLFVDGFYKFRDNLTWIKH